jgi:hypothetical protein
MSDRLVCSRHGDSIVIFYGDRYHCGVWCPLCKAEILLSEMKDKLLDVTSERDKWRAETDQLSKNLDELVRMTS